MRRLLSLLRETALLMVGQPSYEAYLEHMATSHPDRLPMSRIEFFRDRESTRYGGKGGGRCC
ncbi:MAG: CstA-like transporter-associated (seleno)protein [Novosphingobium sp.]